jgi:hypothetical protein
MVSNDNQDIYDLSMNQVRNHVTYACNELVMRGMHNSIRFNSAHSVSDRVNQ